MENGVLGALFVLACFVVLILMGLAVLVALIMKLFEDHTLAAKYRELLELAEKQPTPSAVPMWKLTYREGRKTHTVLVPGATEGEAMAVVLRDHNKVNLRSIVSLEKV